MTSTTPPRAEPGGILIPPCDDTGGCGVGFILDDGDYYALECISIRDSAVSDEVVGEGDLYGDWATVNVIEGLDDRVLVAVSQPGACDLGRDEESLPDWLVAFAIEADGGRVLEALCRVGELTASERDANGC